MSKKDVAKVAKMMDETGLMEITSEYSACWGLFKRKLHLSKQNICVVGAATGSGCENSKFVATPENPMFAEDASPEVKDAVVSPMVGIVYMASDPTAKPFVTVGKQVREGDTLCLVEAMKTFNPIKATRGGVVTEILVKEGEAVEYGTPLVVVK